MLRSKLSSLSATAVFAMVLTLVLALGVALATLTPLPRVVSVGGSDKFHHVAAFAALALPVSLLRPRWLLAAVVLLALYGAAIEVIQPLVGRSRELADWIADLGGIALGSLIGLTGNRLAVWVQRSRARLREAS